MEPSPRTAFWSRVLQLDDRPARVALALAVGVFISCTPFWGVQTLLSVTVATVFRLNRLATVAGTWLNLPWFAPFVYAAALKIGTTVLPDPDGTRSAWLGSLIADPGRLSWRLVLELLPQISLALVIGTTIVGTIAAVATYVVARTVIAARRQPPAV